MPNKKTDRKAPVEVVLGSGGIKGFAHLGVLESIEERNLAVSTYTGISIGAAISALYCNGYSTEAIRVILFEELQKLHPARLKLSLTTPLSILCGMGFLDLQEILERLVERYQLRPRPNLRILAFNLVTRQPVCFSGENYDLSLAVSASCAVPLVMRPVWIGSRSASDAAVQCLESWLAGGDNGIYVDGAIHHPNPSPETGTVAVVSKLGFARRLPSEPLHLIDLLFHVGELLCSPLLAWYFDDPDPARHIVVEAAPANVACLTFGLSKSLCLRMVGHGRRESRRALSRAAKRGVIAP